MMQPLGRKVYEHIVRTGDMPEELIKVFKATEEENYFGIKARKEYRTVRENCGHEVIITATCTHCIKNCTIRKCKECNTFEISCGDSAEPLLPRNLLCNYNFKGANFYWDKKGFFGQKEGWV